MAFVSLSKNLEYYLFMLNLSALDFFFVERSRVIQISDLITSEID